MKISLNWLRDFLPGLAALGERGGTESVARVLTGVGLEVEGIFPQGHALSGVLVAEVLALSPHPSADKLRIVRVRTGLREEDVVCGAANVPAPGGRVIWAAPGARLPGGLTIAARAIRGVMSSGMLVSGAELGLGEGEGDGIIVLSVLDPGQAGDDFLSVLGVHDDVLEVNVTPNRPDALSHRGIARELAGALGIAMQLPGASAAPRTVSVAPPRTVAIADPALCPRYRAGFVRDLAVAPSPFLMRQRLRSCGVRPISNLVDVTNYVLLELGHPLHAFDDDKLLGNIEVRLARPGETIDTLDKQSRALEPGDIVIADQSGPVALAGVMGGARTEVTAATRHVLLEAATFDGVRVRRTARRLALHSESSHRFERGVDAEGIAWAAERATALLAMHGGGTVAGDPVDVYPRPPVPRAVTLSLAQLHRVSGLPTLTIEQARASLVRIGVEVRVNDVSLTATVPSYRPDLSGPEDLIEEILRLVGYESVPVRVVAANAISSANPEGPADRARDRLAAAGLHEIVSWGFVPRAALHALGAAGGASELTDGLVVKNPISADYEVMRTSLLPGLVDAVRRNLARGVESPWFFEVGPVVRRRAAAPDENSRSPGGASPAHEPTHAAGILCGRLPGWLRPGAKVDFHDAKNVVADLLLGFGAIDVSYVGGGISPVEVPPSFLHPGVAATIRSGAVVVGCVGEIHPAVRDRLALDVPAFYFEVDLDQLQVARSGLVGVTRGKQAPPRFPGASRDISFFIEASVPAAVQEQAMRSANQPLLVAIAVLEDFRDPARVPAGNKGMLWSVSYRSDDRTLTDAEVDAAHAGVLAALRAVLPVETR